MVVVECVVAPLMPGDMAMPLMTGTSPHSVLGFVFILQPALSKGSDQKGPRVWICG